MGTGERTRQPRWEIADVLARTDLTQLLDELATPATHSIRGRRWHCPMPDHDDQHASVTMHTDHRGHERWRCWSGDHTHRGDAIDLIVATQRVNRADAIAWLANRAGMIPDQPLPPARRKPQRSRPSVVPLDPSVVRYVHACEKILWGHTGAPVRDWLHARGFEDDLLRANHVGADPGRAMMSRQRGLPHGHSLAATFPALDPEGNVQYVQARYLEPIGSDKYDNPAGSLGSNPRLAWTRTPDGHTTAGVLLVTEGIPDALTAAGAGYAAVGILGSQAPDDRVADALVRHSTSTDRLLIAIADADSAGRAWSLRLTELVAARGGGLRVIEPPDGQDLNGWASEDRLWTSQVGVHSRNLIRPPQSRLEHLAT
jgi:hypothetical protein